MSRLSSTKITDAAVYKLLMEAYNAAQTATTRHIENNPNVWYPCGFAWVIIKPARGPLIKYMKEHNFGHKSDNGGWMVYNPSNNPTQWMDAKYEGAKAFAKVLTDAGFNCVAQSRID